MGSLDGRREEYRQYLQCSGVIDSLTHALMKLYDQTEKPDDAVKFVRKHMCEKCVTDEQYAELKELTDAYEKRITELQRELSKVKGSIKRSPSEIELLLSTGMDELEADEESVMLLKQFLTRDVYNQLRPLETSLGSNLLDTVQSGFENHDSHVGIYAPDAEAYDVFAPLFNPIIQQYHGEEFTNESTHPEKEWGDLTSLGDLDPEREFILSTRVRCARSIVDYPFNPKMKLEDYTKLESEVSEVVTGLDGEFKGQYHSLLDMDKELVKKLVDEHYMFKENDRFLESARASRFWPDGRGIFINELKTFVVWVNEEDHLRIISMQCGGNLACVYARLAAGVDKIAESINFSTHPRLGYLTFCPTNLGSTIRASVHIKIPKLATNPERLQELADQFHLQIRGTSGEHSETENGVFDISNRRRLGITEFEAVKEMYEGIAEIIKVEKECVQTCVYK